MRSNITYLILVIFLFNSVSSFSQSEELDDNKFLIVLDVQADYTKDLDSIEGIKFINSINDLIQVTKPENVIYVMSLHKALVISFKGFSVDTIVKAELDSNLHIVSNNNYLKEDGDAFTVDEMVAYLNKKNAQEIIVAGLMAEKCVSGTLEGGLDKGYGMIVVPEAIIGKSEKGKKKAIEKLIKIGIKEIELADYLHNIQ